MIIEHYPGEPPEASESRENLRAAFQLSMDWVRSFLIIDEKASKGEYGQALSIIKEATFPDDVSNRLKKVMETEDEHLIEQVLNEYKARIGHAFCESCWR